MPIFAGGLFHSPTARQRVFRLLDLARSCTDGQAATASRPHQSWVFGRRPWEDSTARMDVLENGRLVILGQMFGTDQSDFPDAALNPSQHQQILQTQGRALARSRWGNYVVLSLQDDSIAAMLDPMGSTTLFFARINDGVLMSSELWMVQDQIRSPLNHAFMMAGIVDSGRAGLDRETPFADIQQVPPGHFSRIGAAGIEHESPFWLPADHFKSSTRNEQVWRDSMIEQFSGATRALIRGRDNIYVSLSGGLDSSSVLLALDAQPAQASNITAFTSFNPNFFCEDETERAQSIARIRGVRWHGRSVLDHDNRHHVISVDQHRPADVPLMRRTVLTAEEQSAKHVWLTGAGGDHLLGHAVSPDILPDAVLDGRFGKILDYAICRRDSIPRVVAGVVKELFHYARPAPRPLTFAPAPPPWVTPAGTDLLVQDRSFIPDASRLLSSRPGQRHLAMSVYHLVRNNTLWTSNRDYHSVSPYASQPFVELLLSIPRYLHFDRHQGKTLFRQAMGEAFNVDMTATLKGMYSHGIYDELIGDANVVYADFLQTGTFARLGLVDQQGIDTAFERMICHGEFEDDSALLSLVSAQRWIHGWHDLIEPSSPRAATSA